MKKLIFAFLSLFIPLVLSIGLSYIWPLLFPSFIKDCTSGLDAWCNGKQPTLVPHVMAIFLNIMIFVISSVIPISYIYHILNPEDSIFNPFLEKKVNTEPTQTDWR